MKTIFYVLLMTIFSVNGLAGPRTLWAQEDIATAQVETHGAQTYFLSLEEATRLALLNNFDIQLAKYDTWIARTGQKAAESIYDTVINAEAAYKRDRFKKPTTILGSEIKDTDYNVGISKQLPTGTTINVDMTNNKNETDAIFALSPTLYESTLGVRLEQSLGKNFFGLKDRGSVKIKRIDIENAQFTSIDNIEQQIAEVQKAYWDLVLQVQHLKIEQGIVKQAEKLYELHQRKLADGLVEMPEALASEANYKKRQSELKRIENEVQTKANVLRLLLNITDDSLDIRPGEEFAIDDTQEQLDFSLKSAFENRSDYKKVLNDINIKDIELVIKKTNIWPEVNLVASFKRNGLGDSFSDAINEIKREDNPEVFAGLAVSFPLENNLAESELEKAKLEKARTLLNLKLLERRITISVIDQVRTCNIFKEVASQRQEVAELERRKLKEEEKKFDTGRSDTDTIIRFQEDVLTAELDAAQALFDFHAALVDLRLKEGTILNPYWEKEI